MLFVGIILGHLGFSINPAVVHFFQEFGLILFVYSVGMQVGPGFFSSFKRGGMTLNGLACGIVFLGVGTALVIHFVTGIPIPTMVGILSGAVTYATVYPLTMFLRVLTAQLMILFFYT